MLVKKNRKEGRTEGGRDLLCTFQTLPLPLCPLPWGQRDPYKPRSLWLGLVLVQNLHSKEEVQHSPEAWTTVTPSHASLKNSLQWFSCRVALTATPPPRSPLTLEPLEMFERFWLLLWSARWGRDINHVQCNWGVGRVLWQSWPKCQQQPC